jgi:hypothetical protein
VRVLCADQMLVDDRDQDEDETEDAEQVFVAGSLVGRGYDGVRCWGSAMSRPVSYSDLPSSALLASAWSPRSGRSFPVIRHGAKGATRARIDRDEDVGVGEWSVAGSSGLLPA